MKKTRFERMYEHFRSHACTASDNELLGLFKQHKQAIEDHFESCIPALDGSDFWKYVPSKVFPLSHFHGPLFHKGFRQIDVTDSGADDRRIWELLSGMDGVSASEAFWNAHHHSMKTRKIAPQAAPQPLQAEFPPRIMEHLRYVANRKPPEGMGVYEDGNGEPLQDDADAAIAWVEARQAETKEGR